MQKQADKQQELYELAVKSSKETDFAFRQLLDKAVTMLGTKDPMAYQQVMAMNQTFTVPVEEFDSSDYGEFMKEQLRAHDASDDDDGEVDILAREIGLV